MNGGTGTGNSDHVLTPTERAERGLREYDASTGSRPLADYLDQIPQMPRVAFRPPIARETGPSIIIAQRPVQGYRSKSEHFMRQK